MTSNVEPISSSLSELVMDLCLSLLPFPELSHKSYESILHECRKHKEGGLDLLEMERAWILQHCYQTLSAQSKKHPYPLSPAEQIMLDSNPSLDFKLNFFSSYLNRLKFQYHWILLLGEKWKIPELEIARSCSLPVLAVRHRKEYALELLESWLISPKKVWLHQFEKLQKNTFLHFEGHSAGMIKSFKEKILAFVSSNKGILESAAIGALVGITLILSPDLRGWIQSKVQSLRSESAQIDGDSVPLVRGKLEEHETVDETGGVPIESEDTELDAVIVGNGEVWRYILKSASPRETRESILKYFNDRKIKQTEPLHSGVEAPGGIQFDLEVAKGEVPALQDLLKTLSTASTEGLTWYKTRSKKPVSEGQTRLVIWISQM